MNWKQKATRITKRLWWFDVVYPIALAVILFGSLTYVVYSGTRQMRLSSIADNTLLQMSLKNIDRGVKKNGEVLVVTTDPRTLSASERPPMGRLPEASAILYAKAIRKASELKIPLVYLSWDIEAHPSEDASYLSPLFEAIKDVKKSTHVVIAAPFGSVPRFPKKYRNVTTIVEDSPCNEPEYLQTQCSFDRNWSDWIAQSILNLLGEDQHKDEPNPIWVSDLLNNAYPAYILNLNRRDKLLELELKDFIQADQFQSSARVAFIGADQSRAISSLPEGYVTRRVITQYDSQEQNVSIQGTPLHVFWAQIAQMYIDESMVSIPSTQVVSSVVIVFCLFILAVMWFFGGPAALGMFLVYVAAGPYANAFSMKFLNVYVPLFDSYYFGLTTFLLAGFGRLSFSAFQRWRLEEQTRFHTLTADLKGNFISLLSHNLNTPVAKMQGMLAILANQPGSAVWNQDIRRAERYVAQLELGIRGVLIGSALDEGSLNPTPRSVKALADEFILSNKGSLKRLGVLIESVATSADAEDLEMLPLAFDPKVFNATVAATCALFSDDSENIEVSLSFHVEERDSYEALLVTVSSNSRWIPPHAVSTFFDQQKGTLRTLDGNDFFNDVASGLLRQTVEIYKGSILCKPSGSGGAITFSLRPL